uniref:Uncharacterized protein n=1 Tax=Amphiprion percula TaxID=161767 RepID=A0A3P8RQI5_AMPPE
MKKVVVSCISNDCQFELRFQTVNLGHENVIVWGCFTVSGTGQNTVLDSVLSSASYQRALEDNVKPFV